MKFYSILNQNDHTRIGCTCEWVLSRFIKWKLIRMESDYQGGNNVFICNRIG